MTTMRFSAPGKLFLLGEYAVLDGASALLRAVDRRATVTLAEANSAGDSASGWSLTAPELGIDRLALGPNGSLPDALDDTLAAKLRLFAEVASVVDALATSSSGFHVTIDSAQFVQDGHKLGLGSSAAVAVALTAALAASRSVALPPGELFTLAARAHTAAQSGRGSGADVATSVYGGHLLFRHGSAPRSVTWPSELDLFAVVTGTGSSTVELVARVAAYAASSPVEYRRDLDRLRSLSARAERLLLPGQAGAIQKSSTAAELLRLFDEYFQGLEALDTHALAGIVTARHRELRGIAAASGAIFKTSGAGGGDLGLVFAKLEAADRLTSVFTEVGAAVIPVPVSPDGIREEAA